MQTRKPAGHTGDRTSPLLRGPAPRSSRAGGLPDRCQWPTCLLLTCIVVRAALPVQSILYHERPRRPASTALENRVNSTMLWAFGKPRAHMDSIPHRIVVVGGGAGGLELVTRLGRSLGKRRKAIVSLV